MIARIQPFLIFVFGLFFSSGVAQIKTIPYQQLPTAGGSPTGSNMFFGASMSVSHLTVTFAGPSDRWIAISFGTSMPNTDALIYSVGQSVSPHALGWNDYYISSYSGAGVTNDANQNWTILSNNVASGQRTVVATRTLNTGDANDAVIQYTAAALSVVWARSASADYTIAYHGSSNRANNISLPWLVAPTASFAVSSSSLCSGSSLSFTNQSTGGQLSYQWSFQGGSPATSTVTNPLVSYTTPGTYSVSLVATNSLGTNAYSVNNLITVTPTVAPGISISQISGQNPMCAGAGISFSASPVNGGNAPVYQWKVNGINVGTNNSVYTTNTFTSASLVTCILTSNAVCSSPLTASSSVISVTVNSTAPASISISLSSGSNPMCSGANAGFSASPFNGGNTPVFQWKVNNLNAGTNSPNFTSAALLNGDQVTCELSSNSTCASNTLGLSNAITMSVSAVLVPSVSITQFQGSNPSCSGASLSFSATAFNGGSNPVYQWQLNGASVGSNSAVYPATLNNSGTITCLMISSSSCANPQSTLSAALTITVNPIPTSPSISASGNLNFCEGDSITLFSSAPSGNLWSNGANTTSISVSSSGTYTVTQTINSCVSLPSSPVSVSVHPLPVCTLVPIGPLCLEDAPAILQGVPSGGVFSGTGVNGTVFTPSLNLPGSVALVYEYTDANGCKDTSAINVTISECVGLSVDNKPKENILIYPNPANNLLHVNSIVKVIERIQIFDLNGKEVVPEFLERNLTHLVLSLDSLNAGVYTLKIKTREHSLSFKLCVVKP